MSDQLLPPGSFKPPTRADFKDDSVPSGYAAPSRYVLVYTSEDTYAVYDQITQIIHGGALGIDNAASRVCRDTWPVLTVYAKWKDYGTAAGPIRNQHMAKMADALIAVWDGESRGTKNMIETAKKRGLKVYIHRY